MVKNKTSSNQIEWDQGADWSVDLECSTVPVNGTSLTLSNLNKLMDITYGTAFSETWKQQIEREGEEAQMKQLERFLRHWSLTK